MKKQLKSLLSAALILALLLTVMPASVLAAQPAGEAAADENLIQLTLEKAEIDSGSAVGSTSGSRVTGHISVKHPAGTDVSDAMAAETQDSLPSSYNSTDLGYVTPVRNQAAYGTCWAHAAIASVESYMIKHGIRNGATGYVANTGMDFSESHLAWFAYTNAYDKLGMLNGDKTTPASDYRDLGGNGEFAAMTMMRGEGPASESSNSALVYSNMKSSGLSSSFAYQYNAAQVVDVQWIPTYNRAAVKQAIMEYGAGSFSYCHDDSFEAPSGAYYCPYDYSCNHDVTVVGWDDNYSRTNFKSSARPSSNGAWIIKNSWGTGLGTNGYYYISYEDVPSQSDCCYFYKAVQKDTYQNIYQYDGTTCVDYLYGDNLTSLDVAQTFVANGSEDLRAVSFCSYNEGLSYTLDIYTGCSETNPSSGTKVYTQDGYFAYMGYHTIPLVAYVHLTAGQRFSIVLRLSASSDLYIPVDANDSISGVCSWTHTAHPNTAFYYNGAGWDVSPSNSNFRIKALTNAHLDNPFRDVKEGKYYYDAVLWAYYHNPQITSGAEPDLFGVKQPCTREQIVTFLWKAYGAPEPTNTNNPFPDVNPRKYYYKAVLWAVEKGITRGMDDGNFGVGKTCNRGDVVTFLWIAAGRPAHAATSSPFTDVKAGKYYYDAVLWALEKGVTTGTSATTFSPKQECTREQIVTFLWKALT